MAAGQGFKTFATGDVLSAADVNGYLMQGVLVFATAAARDAAITAPAQGQTAYLKSDNLIYTYNGSAWTNSVGDITAVTTASNSGLAGGASAGAVALTLNTAAKGDLLAGTGSGTASALTVGADATVLTADSTAATGLKWATASSGSPYVAGKNKLINADMGIWQRGTSVAVPGNNVQTFQADRFWAQHNGLTNGTVTYSRQSFTVGQTDVPNNPLYFARITNTTLGTTQSQTEFGQSIEDATTLAGQTATFSFYVKASGTFTLTGFAYQNFGSGGSSSVFTTLTLSTSTTTTSWQRITATVSVPSVSGKTIGAGNYIAFYVRQNTPTAGSTIDFANWQVEIASTASAFQTATGTLQGELAACQRYYWRTGGNNSYELAGQGTGQSTTVTGIQIPLPSSMRVTPTTVDYSTMAVQPYGTGTITAVTSIALDSVSARNLVTVAATVASGLTQGQVYRLFTNNSTSGYIGLSAEL